MSRPRNTTPSPLQARVLVMADGTMTQREIARHIGAPVGSIGTAVSHLREKGHTPIFSGRKMDTRDVMRGLNHAQRVWLRSLVPHGGDMVDVIRAIIVDAYNEEHE